MEPRPFAFHKMEALVKQMQDPETGVPVRSQKIFLTSIPSAFIGYDLIEWLMEHLNIDESGEAVHLANQLCQYGYLFPVTDCKTLTVKDDNSLYRFQAAYYWPWHHRNPDNVEYAIYLVKRTLRNKQRHALEEYEAEALNSLKRNLQNKWELVMMQAEEQVKVGKERKKMDKLVADSQERAYWRVHRPPPGCQPPLEPSPITTLRRTINPLQVSTQIEILKRQVAKSRVKVSQAIEGLVSYSNTYSEYDPLFTNPQPSNPWLSDDPSLWQFNQSIVEVPTEKRVKRWALSFEDLLADPTGVAEFTNYLRKEYSHENIRFWLAVKELRHCAQSQVPVKVNSIYQEFLAHGAPCEINIDSKTQEITLNEMKNPSRFTFDAAAHHVYNALLNKDCYPRFIRSDHYKCLLANALHPPIKKRFFGFGGGGKKKSCTGTVAGVTSKRRGSDRSLSGVIHETSSFTNQMESNVSPEISTPTHKELKQKSVELKQPSEELVSEISTQLEPGPSFIKVENTINIDVEETVELILPNENNCGNVSKSEDVLMKQTEESDAQIKENQATENSIKTQLKKEILKSPKLIDEISKDKDLPSHIDNNTSDTMYSSVTKLENEECKSPKPDQKLCTVFNKVLDVNPSTVELTTLLPETPKRKKNSEETERTAEDKSEKLGVNLKDNEKCTSELPTHDESNECPDKELEVSGEGVQEDICSNDNNQRQADICPWEDEKRSKVDLDSLNDETKN